MIGLDLMRRGLKNILDMLYLLIHFCLVFLIKDMCICFSSPSGGYLWKTILEGDC